MAVIDSGSDSAGKANVDSSFNLQVNSPGYTAGGVVRGGGEVEAGAFSMYSAVDEGQKNGARDVLSPEVDKDYRLRVAQDNMLDQEMFNYTAQNTGKHSFTFTTLTATMGTGGITTNSGSITTTNTGLTFGTHAMFPVGGTQGTICETSVAFSAQPTANVVFDFGLFQRGVTTAFAPLDGVYFRLSSAGLQGVINSGGVETTTSVFPLDGGAGTYTYINNATNRYLIQINNVSTTFWINNFKYGEIPTPAALNFPCKSSALPWSFRHAIVGGAAGTVLQAVVSDYRVFTRGEGYDDPLSGVFSRVLGSYQGLSGGTMGTIGTYTNSTNPTAAVPTNTTAAVGAVGLLNQAWETATLAVNTDGILLSYQVPAGSATVQGRRLKVNGVRLASFIQTVIAGGPVNRVFSLAFGGTTVSLATAESASMATATAKARRIVLLPELTQVITAAQAVNTMVSQPGGAYAAFANPVYVNPGEFVQVIVKQIGTVMTSGVIANYIQLDYSWE